MKTFRNLIFCANTNIRLIYEHIDMKTKEMREIRLKMEKIVVLRKINKLISIFFNKTTSV